MTTTTAPPPVTLAKAPRRYATTPIWDALHAEHGPALQSAALAALEAQAATAAALAGLPAAAQVATETAMGGGAA